VGEIKPLGSKTRPKQALVGHVKGLSVGFDSKGVCEGLTKLGGGGLLEKHLEILNASKREKKKVRTHGPVAPRGKKRGWRKTKKIFQVVRNFGVGPSGVQKFRRGQRV